MQLIGFLAALSLLMVACGFDVGSTSDSPVRPSSIPTEDGEGSLELCTADEFGCVEIAEGDPLVIGSALATTGAFAPLGLDSQYGAQVALNLRGEVLGHEVELSNEDGGCSPDGGTASADSLRRSPGLVAVIGTSCSVAAVPAAEILGDGGVLLVSPSNTAPDLTEPSTHQPFYARTAPNDAAQAAAMAAFACSELGVTTAATIDDGTSYSVQLQEAFAAEFEAGCGGAITEALEIVPGETDVGEPLAEVATSHEGSAPELLYYPVAAPERLLVTREAKRTSELADVLLATLQTSLDGSVDVDYLSAAGESADGSYLTAQNLSPAGSFYESTFLAEYRAVSGEAEPIGAFHAHAFDAVNLILDSVLEVSVENGGSLFVPRTRLRDVFFETRGYQGLSGTLSCSTAGDCADASVSVLLVQDADYEPVWP